MSIRRESWYREADSLEKDLLRATQEFLRGEIPYEHFKTFMDRAFPCWRSLEKFQNSLEWKQVLLLIAKAIEAGQVSDEGSAEDVFWDLGEKLAYAGDLETLEKLEKAWDISREGDTDPELSYDHLYFICLLVRAGANRDKVDDLYRHFTGPLQHHLGLVPLREWEVEDFQWNLSEMSGFDMEHFREGWTLFEAGLDPVFDEGWYLNNTFRGLNSDLLEAWADISYAFPSIANAGLWITLWDADTDGEIQDALRIQ